jgi:hypothetical protein
MFGLDHVLTWILLAAPPEWVAPFVQPCTFALLQPALRTTGVYWELLDTREVRYILARPDDFLSDFALLRRRYQDLADAPALYDGLRFPDSETASRLLAFNRSYRQYLTNRQPVEILRWGDLRAAAQETDQLYHIWDTVRDARCEYYYVTVRRQALKKLRDLLGPEAYYSGRLPPPVPLWRYQSVD